MYKLPTITTTAFYTAILTFSIFLTGCGGGGGGAAIPAAVDVSVSDASVTEGDAGTANLDFTVTLSEASDQEVSVDYVTEDDTASAGSDYTSATGTLTIPAGSTSGTITVVVSGDVVIEADETITLTLSNPTNANITAAVATGTITNDDVLPDVSISSASVTEGNAGSAILSFTVTLNKVFTQEVSVDYATSNETALAGSDYTSVAGTLTIPAGSTTNTVMILVSGDLLFETDETFILTLSNPSNANITTATATGSITNDDAVPSLSIANSSVAEGNAGTTNLALVVTLSAVSALETTVDYVTANGTALAGSDYNVITAATLTIPAGSTTGTVNIAVFGDTVFEADEAMTVVLSNPVNATLGTATATGVINNDDQTPITMTISGKTLNFTWGADSFTGILPANIDHYRISVNPDGASGFTLVPSASNISTLSYGVEIAVHKTDWLAAQYIVEACNLGSTVCIASSNQTLALIDSVAATIYAKASNTDAGDEFGWSVALSDYGNTLAVSAIFERSNAPGINGNQAVNSATNAGAVYVFVKTGTTWSQQAYINASNAGGGDRFGYSVSLSSNGNKLAVSARREGSGAVGIGGNEADNTVSNAGAVYVFSRTGTIWTQEAYVKASNTDANDFFGVSVSLSGDGSTLAVSTVHEDSAAIGINGNQADNTAASAGAVYIFINNGITWAQQAYIKASNTEQEDQFGGSVSLNFYGNTLAVAANSEASAATEINGNQADNAAANSGAVYVFARTGTTWTQQAYVKASNAEAGDRFGIATSLNEAGNLLAVGANFEDSAATGIAGNQASNATPDSGAVYIFSRTGTIWSQQTYIKASNPNISDEFGYSVSLSGDGATLAVGARREDSSATGINGDETADVTAQINSGAVYVFTNNGGIWAQQSYVKAPTAGPADWFSYSVSLSSDGDTLAVGANLENSNATGIGGNQADNSMNNSGAVYLY